MFALMTDLLYRMFIPGDEEQIVELLKNVFPGWGGVNSLSYWKWKYQECPVTPDIYLAKDGEKTVAVDHRLIFNVKIGESILRASYGDDLAVHPDYRGMNISSNLRARLRERWTSNNINFFYVATENPIVKTTFLKMSNHMPLKINISHLLRVRKRDAFLKNKKRDDLVTRIGLTVLTEMGRARQFTSSGANSTDFSIIDADWFDDRIDNFWDKVKDSYDYSLEKKSDYLNWRYNNPHLGLNKLRLAVDNGEVQGFTVLNLSESDGYSEGAIRELLTLSDRMDVANGLIQDACDYFESKDVAAMYYAATKGHPYESLMKNNGFIDASNQKETYFYYTIIGGSIPESVMENLDPSRVQLSFF